MPKQPGQSAAQKRIARTEAYAASIGRMFDETVRDILKLKLAKPTEEGVMYSFDGDTMQVRKKVEALLKRLHGAATLAIAKGVEKEWNIANQECDDLVKNIFGKKLFESDRFRAWTAHNEGAMNAFINRSDKGMNLSDRVWKSARQLRDEMEVALTVGMAEGDSAAGLSRQVRQCLNDPDLMFRRFRYKKGEDENGNPIWGRKWKKKVIEDGKTKWIDYDKDSYIPKGAGYHSRGVYKSAAKNAMRVARTETNMAYRRSDYERWQQMSFILGIRIEMSNQHPKPDICDEMQGDYPKNFYFSGWHPMCFCYATPILISEDEMAKVNSEFLQGRTYQPQGQPVLDTPPNFKQWIKDNRERILDANSLPYWIKDNPMFVDAKKGAALTPDPAKIEALFPKKPVRTQEQADALIKRRQEELAQFAKNEKYAAGVIETARNYSKDIDLTRIEDLNARHQYTRAAEEAKRIEQTIAQIKADEAKLKALIPNVEQLHKDYSILELKASYNSIKKTLAAAKKLNLQDQYSLFEAQANAAGNQLLKDIYTKRLNEVKIDINIERMRPEVASYQKIAASSSIAAFKPIIDQAEIYLNKRLDWAAQDLLDRIKQYEPLLKRYEDMLSYYKTTPAGMGTTKTDSKIGIALKAAEKNMFVKDKYDDVLKEIELAEKTKATNEANQARRAAKKAATATPKAPKEIDVSRATFDELEKELGDDLPVLLKDYKRSVARTGDVDSIYLREAKDIERKFKDFFESQAYGHAVPHNLLDIEADYYENGGSWGASRKGEGIYIKKGIPTNLLVNQYGEKVWSKGWSLKGSGYDESRRSWGHWAYNKQSSQYSKVKKADRLQDNDYYVCGTPMSKDKQEAWSKRKATGYGDTLITLRKERVVATFTYGNSLGQRTIPSLASDPKVCSLDKQTFKNYKAAKYTSHEQVISGSYASYIEMQYLPRAKSGFISPRDFESITFPGNPKKLISQKALDQWKKHGVDIYYADSKGKVVLFQKGDPFITQAEAKARLDSMQNELDNWRKNAAALTNKDISFSELEKHLKGKDYISALSETEKLQRQLADMEKREKAMEKLIPDVKKWHKQFTIDELEAAHVAIQKQLDWLENQYIPKNGKEAVIGKIGRIIGDNQTQKKYSTWEVANQAYARKRDEIVYELRKDTIDDNLQRLRSFKTKDKTFLKKLQDIEDKVKTKSWYELEDMIAQAKDKMMSLSTGNLQKALKLGESTAVKFDPSEFTQDMRDVAKWFNAEGTTAAAMRKAYKEADAYMSKYAQDMWKKLTDEEKKVLWMYTDGSQYINQEILGCYMLRMKSPWGEFRNGLKDANMITSVIEKAPALQEGMWMQSGKSTGAFEGMFGIDIGRVKDLSTLVGKEGTSNAFTSCHAASNGYFVKGGNTGAANDIVMSIYMPKGTKGIYMEPFASWGDSKRGLAGYNWDGKKQKTAPSDQVEFLLQRGARFKITKAYVGKDGKWHIDVDLIEQPSMKALNEKLPTDYNWRSIRYPNYTAP